MHGPKNQTQWYSSIADRFTLNSNELTWIALMTFGVIAVSISM